LTPKGIYELLGIALGCIGLRYDEFCNMDYLEFAAVYDAYATQRDLDYKDKWTRMRLLATIVIQPHLGRGKKLTPEKLLPFPWEKKKHFTEGPSMTPDEQRRRMEDLVKKLGDDLI
jgi:hypothetical protein